MKTKDSSFTNVSTIERAATVLGGAFMVYKALKGEKKQILPAVAGACMVLRGTTGHCPVYGLLEKRRIAQ